MIDMHTHILPCIDDGAENEEVSLELIRREVEQGVDTIVFTPHYYGQKFSPERFLENRQKAFEKIEGKFDGVNVKMAAEVYFSEEKIASTRSLCKLAIEGTKYILLELPLNTVWSEALWFRLRDFVYDTEYTPIIAHAERYAEINKNPKYLSVFADMGCLIQVNTRSFLDERSSQMAFTMLKKGLVHCLATDAHNLEERAPDYAAAKAAIEAAGGGLRFEEIQKNMRDILNGETVEVGEYEPMKRFFKKFY